MVEKGRLPEPGILLHAIAAWMVCACVLLCIGTLVANAAGFGEQALAYISSAISFVCAFSAGAAAAKRSGTARFLTALFVGTVLIVLLLTVGFLIRGEGMNPSSLLSVVSFTYAGAMTGMLLFPHPGKKSRSSYRRRN